MNTIENTSINRLAFEIYSQVIADLTYNRCSITEEDYSRAMREAFRAVHYFKEHHKEIHYDS